MKRAVIFKDKTGYWAVEDRDTGKRIGRLQNTELDAYRLASSYGYLVC